ncbi:MAG: UDP-glucose 4-epimerase GalE, partial [Planctomycetes bacterium]|nr:UDP-glucose 4-epimerase GalE [Planctomycetota bacterium]
MKVTITGGAGYVGSHVAAALVNAGHDVQVLDDLTTGHAESVAHLHGANLVQVDILDTRALTDLLASFSPSVLIHMAGKIAVGESVRVPDEYYTTNITGGLSVLKAMIGARVKRLVFSSSAAVYGPPDEIPIPENHRKNPTSPYGNTKWMFEQMLRDYAGPYSIGSVSMRYFNAAGADPSGDTGEAHAPETHLIPLVIRAVQTNVPISIFGTDYDTPDGTAVRDYIHVCDLATAHVYAAENCPDAKAVAYNCGTGVGYSVKEVITACGEVLGKAV